MLSQSERSALGNTARNFLRRTSPTCGAFSFPPPFLLCWCGKQFACSVLNDLATKPVLCFIDADVELTSTGLGAHARGSAAQAVRAYQRLSASGYANGFGTLLLPLMHFLLLGFLPLSSMRKLLNPAFAAGCGQIFVADGMRIAG